MLPTHRRIFDKLDGVRFLFIVQVIENFENFTLLSRKLRFEKGSYLFINVS